MKAMQHNLNEWLRREAHIVAGHPFQMEDCSCLPVAPETQVDEDAPVGFLVTHGSDVAYVPAKTPDGEEIMTAWTKLHTTELTEEKQSLPSEYWYG